MGGNWISEQASKIKSLKGQTVVAFVGTEMAFCGGEDGSPPQFDNASLPFVQLGVLYLKLASGNAQKFITYQNDVTWGLYVTDDIAECEPRLDEGSNESIYRTRALNELPTGLIRFVEVKLDSDGELAEVLLGIEDDSILLVSGEVYEIADGKLEVVKGDESVLVFRHPGELATVQFRPRC